MNDLRISLLGIGALAIAGVYIFNLWQERRARGRAEKAFAREHDDVLMQDDGAPPAVRKEPRLHDAFGDDDADLDGEVPPAAAITAADSAAFAAAGPAHAASGTHHLPDPGIDYVAELELNSPADGMDLLEELRALALPWKKPLRAARYEAGDWHDLRAGAGSDRLRYALQLVNRAGHAAQAELGAFHDTVARWSVRHGATLNAADAADAHRMGADLDAFCADVDVAIGVNVVSPVEAPFSGTQIRALAEAAGMQLEPDGVFYRRDDNGAPMFTLDNHEPMPFVPEQMRTLHTHGVTFLLDLPRAGDGRRAFDAMVGVAKDFAQVLGGSVVDDNRAPLSDAAIAKIRDQMCTILAKMDAAHVAAGGARALRLFS